MFAVEGLRASFDVCRGCLEEGLFVCEGERCFRVILFGLLDSDPMATTYRFAAAS